ncbi:hypothetical protein [Orientia tsutsugamushi]|uniref:Uncharacterized protein n=1 Tax=Orientia tsutsugamushi TaxID=784 RepID=A0A2U3RSU2_ORITS|nr:hypothetical protein [Orientia tsutsugamushi]KJV50818.1 hypothetical protein OTSKARP_1569 [Orientia tsutsugamushi str. Karp]SPR16286.1 Uncharacterised protein [Orientia tsutsugamushi]
MKISDTSDSIQILPNSNNLAELTNLVHNCIFNHKGYNILFLLGWDNSTYRGIQDKIVQLRNTETEAIRLIRTQDDLPICLEYYCIEQGKRNVLYTQVNFAFNTLRLILEKHYDLSIWCQRYKSNLTIVYNTHNENLQKQLDDFFTQQCMNHNESSKCIHHNESSISVLDIDQFRDFIGDILLIDDPER